MAWVRGPRCDYDDWADAVGDDWWKWENVQHEICKLEDFRPEVPEGQERYASPTPGSHGKGGPIAVGYGRQWQSLIQHCMTASEEAGHHVNPDNNDGDTIGVSIAQFNVDLGTRVTSTTAFLDESSKRKLDNLVVVTGTLCSKICFHDKSISGVELLPTTEIEGTESVKVGCRREVVLTAGTFQSAQLLLLSGIGPVADLASVGIPIVNDLQAVGTINF